MNRKRRWMLPALCAAIGIGTALGLGLALEPPAGPTADPPASPQGGPATIASRPKDPPAEPTEAAVLEPWAAQTRPILVEPSPALGAQAQVEAEAPSPPALGPTLGALWKAAGGPAATEPILAGPPTVAPESVPPVAPAPAAAPPAPPATQSRITKRRTPQGDLLSINIQNADVREVLEMLSQQGDLNILVGKDVEGQVSASLVNVSLESALAAILKSTGYVARREGPYIFVGTPDDLETMRRTADRIGTRVYHPNYVTSAELQKLITPMLTKEVGVVSVTSASAVGIASDEANAGGDAYAGTEAVVVRDYEAVLCQIDQLVAALDLRPMQVHIEAMILSVAIDDTDAFGVNFELLRQNDNIRFGWGTVPKDFTKFAFDGGLKFGFLDENLGAFLDALETIGDTNVIATPRMMVVNKHRAEIQIGKKKGYVNTTQTTTAATQSVEFLELGTILRLRPFISRDGLIRMEVHPEISDGDVKVEQGYTLPNSELTQVTTNIMVRDGCTVVIGGLLQDEQKISRTQIPLLGNLPVVGVVFRNKDEEITRRELIILITPHIVYEPDTCREGAKASCEFHRRHMAYAEKLSPISKMALGRKYVRRAKAAWAEGDRTEALRLAELAVQFDPRSREAINLRSDIWLGKPYGEHSIQGPPPSGPPTDALDGQTIEPWLLDELGRPEAEAPAVLHPRDPGRPGDHRDLRVPNEP